MSGTLSPTSPSKTLRGAGYLHLKMIREHFDPFDEFVDENPALFIVGSIPEGVNVKFTK